jgi:hypothetical protein
MRDVRDTCEGMDFYNSIGTEYLRWLKSHLDILVDAKQCIDISYSALNIPFLPG